VIYKFYACFSVRVVIILLRRTPLMFLHRRTAQLFNNWS